jgi:hypothetical protein
MADAYALLERLQPPKGVEARGGWLPWSRFVSNEIFSKSPKALATLAGPAPATPSDEYTAAADVAVGVILRNLCDADQALIPPEAAYQPHATWLALANHWSPRSGTDQAARWQALELCRQTTGESVEAYRKRFVALSSAVAASGLEVPMSLLAYLFFFHALPSLRAGVDIERLAPERLGGLPAAYNFVPLRPDVFKLVVVPKLPSADDPAPDSRALDRRTIIEVAGLLARRETAIATGAVAEKQAEAMAAAESALVAGTTPSSRVVARQPRPATGKFCVIHKSSTHDTSECTEVAAAAKRVEGDRTAERKRRGGRGRGEKGGTARANVAGDSGDDASTVSGCAESITVDVDAFCALAGVAETARQLALLLDTGATRTFSPHAWAFQRGTYARLDPPRQVMLGDGHKIDAIGRGTIVIDARVNGKPRTIELTNSWHTPRMKLTLVSVRHLNTLNLGAYFPPNGLCTVVDRDQTVAHATNDGSGWLIGGRLRKAPETRESALAALDELTAHLRLGHPSSPILRRTAQLVDGLDLKRLSEADRYCRACRAGKAKARPHQRTTPRSRTPGAILVVDLVGAPGDPPSYNGEIYAMTLTDEATSRETCVLLKRKSDAADRIMAHIREAKTQYGHLCLKLRRDGARELDSAELRRFCRKRGIVLQSSMPHAHASNGLAERSVGLMTEGAATALAAAACAKLGLPKSFWGFAMLHASYARRFWPSPHIEGKSREEAYTGTRPDASPLRAFASEAEIKLRKVDRESRYGQQTVTGIVVGYAYVDGQKGWIFAVPREVRGRRVGWDLVRSFNATFREQPLVDAVHSSRYDTVFGPSPPRTIVLSVDPDDAQSTAAPDVPAAAPEAPAAEPAPRVATPEPPAPGAEPDIPLEDAPVLPRELAPAHPDAPVAPRDVGAVHATQSRLRSGARAAHADIVVEWPLPSAQPPRRLSGKHVDAELASIFEDSLKIEDLNAEWEPPLDAVQEGQLRESALTENLPGGAGSGSGPHVGARSVRAAVAAEAPSASSTKPAIPLSDTANVPPLFSMPQTEVAPGLVIDPFGAAHAFAAMGGVPTERVPRNYRAAMAGPAWREWTTACDDELDGLAARQTYRDLEPDESTEGYPILPTQFVLSQPTDADGASRKKARCVVLGNRQHEDSFDPARIFAPTARHESTRLFCAIAAQRDLPMTHYDVERAFLYAPLKERIYARLPTGRIVRLLRALYGLKQAAAEWHALAERTLLDMGFKPISADRCVFVGTLDGHLVVVLLYVDDLRCASKGGAPRFEAELRKRFNLKPLGKAPLFLGCKIVQDLAAGTVSISQAHYTETVLRRFGMADANPNALPMLPGLDFTAADCAAKERLAPGQEPYPYLEVVGCLMWLALITRPDIACAVMKLARYMSNHGTAQIAAAKALLRYLAGTRGLGLVYRRDAPDGGALHAYSDASFADHLQQRTSTLGYLVYLAGAPIAWSSRKAQTIPRSSLDAEYYAIDGAVCELMWAARWLGDVDVKPVEPPLRCDSEGAIALARNQADHGRSKHVDVKHHFVRQAWRRRAMDLARVTTGDNIADALTKALARDDFERHRARLVCRVE